MKFYDYCVFDYADGMPGMAAELGWGGLCLLKDGPAGMGKIDPVKGLLIETEKVQNVKKEAVRNRKRFEIIVASGLNEDVNRAAVETPEIDILVTVEGARIDHVMVKLAAKNNVALGFDFRQLLHSSGVQRSRIFSRMRENAKLVKKFRAPFVITSGSVSEWDMRAPFELTAFGRLLGFEEPAIKEALSGKMIENNRKKLGGKWVQPGVEVE